MKKLKLKLNWNLCHFRRSVKYAVPNLVNLTQFFLVLFNFFFPKNQKLLIIVARIMLIIFTEYQSNFIRSVNIDVVVKT